VYCYQISSAMEYLARNKIVHCDLAARNVLMKRYNHVEVTDFGLARILEGANPTSTINNKIPVKWMPIECLANRKHTIYSEATDVWSFGVTCWEILVYGEMPYKLVTLPKGRDQAESLFQYLDNGGRLKQPSNCSQELYQLLLTCWATSPDSRPKFKSLKETLRQYNRAPHQFVLDRQLPQRMDSTADSEQHQRKLLEDLLRDSDFTNPVDDEISNYFNQTSMTNMTTETDLPPSPTSPSRPLMGTRHTRLSSTGTNSTRYKSEPGGKRQLSITTESGLLDEEITDEENYLVPKSGANDENLDASSNEPDVLYTPVIARTMDYANAESPEDHDYLNAVTSEYYKPPPDYSPPRRLTNGSIPLEYVNTESSV
jgi:serine/threonine protein kinase